MTIPNGERVARMTNMLVATSTVANFSLVASSHHYQISISISFYSNTPTHESWDRGLIFTIRIPIMILKSLNGWPFSGFVKLFTIINFIDIYSILMQYDLTTSQIHCHLISICFGPLWIWFLESEIDLWLSAQTRTWLFSLRYLSSARKQSH